MARYVIKRLLLAFVTTFIILSLTFILMKLLPFTKPIGNDASEKFPYYMNQVNLGFVVDFKNPVEGYGPLLWSYKVQGDHFTHYFYQTPVMQQYFYWLRNIFTKWDWGTSVTLMPNASAIAIIAKGLPTSMVLNIYSVLVSVPLGIFLGIWAALKKNKPTDTIISTLIMVFISIPSFVLITLAISLFGYNTHLLPTQWNGRPESYVIPIFVLSFGSICGYCRFTRAELCEVMESEYLLLARTKGLTKRQAILRHALRNAMVPIVPSILAEFIGILGGSMILESLYGIPGVGYVFIDAIKAKDFNVLFVDMALFTTISLVAAVFLDLSYGFIDPRIRMGAKNK